MEERASEIFPILVFIGFIAFIVFRFVTTRKWYIKLFNLSIKAKCGHKTKVSGYVEVKGKKYYQELDLNFGSTYSCFDCLTGKALTCVWCKKPIFSHTPMRAFLPIDPENYLLPMDLELIDEEHPLLVGCTDPECPGFDDELVKVYHGFVPVKASEGHMYENIKYSILERRRKRKELLKDSEGATV